MRILKLIIWITILSGGVFFWNYHSFSKQTLEVSERLYEVVAGDSWRSILQKETGSEIFTKVYLKNNPPDFHLQKGTYKIQGEYSIEEFIQAFKKPINQDEQVTILEGWNIYDIDKELTKQGLVKQGEFIAYVTQGNFDNYHFLIGLNSLEGYLYPDTYNINPNTFSVEKLVSQMLSNFNTKIYQPLFSHADNETIFETITLASIVQKEASFGDDATEIATIAGILKKRYHEGWRIGADATVCYAHQVATQDCTPREVLEYLYDVNPYNTRAMTGIPQGPIANPEAKVVEATLHSKNSEYYYYLHDNSGQIHYGRTDGEHNRNKNRYLR